MICCAFTPADLVKCCVEDECRHHLRIVEKYAFWGRVVVLLASLPLCLDCPNRETGVDRIEQLTFLFLVYLNGT